MLEANTKRLQAEMDLVKRLIDKDSDALAFLYDNYSATLLGVIIRLVNNQDLAEEVLQDTFLKIWSKIDSYNEQKGRLYTWMHKIARNLALDKIRSKEFVKMGITDTITDNIKSSSEFQVDNQLNKIFSEDLLKHLNDDQAFIIRLMYFQGYTGEDVSKKHSIPLGTVKSRVRAALKKLRIVYGIKLKSNDESF